MTRYSDEQTKALIIKSARRLTELLDDSIGKEASGEMIVIKSALDALDATEYTRVNTPATELRKSVLLLLQTIGTMKYDDSEDPKILQLEKIGHQVNTTFQAYDKWRTAITTRKVNEIRSVFRAQLIDLLFHEGEMSFGHHQLLNGYLENSDLMQQIHDHIKELE